MAHPIIDAALQLGPVKRARDKVRSVALATTRYERERAANEKLRALLRKSGKSPALLDFQPGEYERAEVPVWRVDSHTPGGDLPIARADGTRLQSPVLRYLTVSKMPDEDPASTKRQGSEATPWRGTLPYVDTREDMQPYDIRGYSHHHGEMRRFYRGDPAVRDAVNKTVSFIARGTWEVECPEVDPRLAELHGIDLDRVKRAADLLNLEFTLTRDIDHREWRKIMARDGMVEGFHISEFGIDPNALPGRRLQWLEHRVPSSVQGWIRNKHGDSIGFTQVNPNGLMGSRGAMAAVDLRKCLYFATDWEPGNPEGVSPLRAPWSVHRLAVEYIQSAILHRRRFGTGIPFVQALAGANLGSEDMQEALDTVSEYVSGINSGLAMPDGVSFGIQDPPSDSQLIAVLDWCVKQKRMAIGARFLDMGQDGVGSYAQGTNAMRVAMAALEGYVSGPERAFDSMIRLYCDACIDEPMLVYPQMKIRNLVVREERETVYLVESATKLQREGGRIDDVNFLREAAGLEPIREGAEEDDDERPHMDIATATGVAQIVQQAESGQISRHAARKILESIGYEPEQSAEIIPDDPQPTQPEPRAAAADLPDKYSAINFDFPDGAVDEAKRALEWSREYGRGGTDVGARRASQIAGRKAMAPDTWRRTKAFFDRFASQRERDGWDRDDNGEPSNLRIAWAMWGGDPMYAAARRVVKSLDAADGTERSACCDHTHVHAVPRAARNVESETRGGMFATFRALTESEQRVNLPELEKRLNRAEDDIDSAIIAVQRRHRDEYTTLARPLLADGRADAVAALSVDYTAEYLEAIEARTAELQAFVRDDMRDEIKAQVGDTAAVPQVNTQGAPSESQVRGSAALLAQRVNDDTNRRLQSAAFNVATGGGLSMLTRMQLGIGHRTGLLVAQVASVAANEARDQVAQEGPRVKWATYSAVMDFLTCDVCASFDQRRYKYPSAEYEKAKPPNPRCNGFQSTGGAATPCRCIMVYEFEGADGDSIIDDESQDLVTRSQDESAEQTRSLDENTERAYSTEKVFRIVCGVPTSGKSTYARELAERGGWGVVIDFDDYVIGQDRPRAESWAIAMTDVARACKEHDRVAFVSPLVSPASRARLREYVRDADPERIIEVVRVQPPTLDEIEERNAARPPERQIPLTALFNMVAEWYNGWLDTPDETMEYVQTLDVTPNTQGKS